MEPASVAMCDHDLVLVNSSGGKDSAAMLAYLAQTAEDQGYPRERLLVVHADLGRAEWPGTLDLVHAQAAVYGLRVEVVSRALGDLLEQVEQRGMWPSSTARYCTSDHKTSQVAKVMTREAARLNTEHGAGRPARILNCLGMRAQESSARAKKVALGPDVAASNGRRTVTRWLPIHDWTEEQVWACIDAAGLPRHPAYAAGMSRLSCRFCVLANDRDLVLSARLNPELAQTYADLEARIGHDFKHGRSMAAIIADATSDRDLPPTRTRGAGHCQSALW